MSLFYIMWCFITVNWTFLLQFLIPRDYMDALLSLNLILCRLVEIINDSAWTCGGLPKPSMSWSAYIRVGGINILPFCKGERFDREPLIFIGENSQFHAEAVHKTAKLDRWYSALLRCKLVDPWRGSHMRCLYQWSTSWDMACTDHHVLGVIKVMETHAGAVKCRSSEHR